MFCQIEMKRLRVVFAANIYCYVFPLKYVDQFIHEIFLFSYRFFSIGIDDTELIQHVQRLRTGILCADEINTYETRLPLQVIRLPGKQLT